MPGFKNNQLPIQIKNKFGQPLKVALCHDWLTGHRGGERVLEVFCELFPNASIYTLFYNPGSVGPIIERHNINTSFLNSLPGVHKYYRKLLPFLPMACRSLKIKEDVDLVLSSSHCVIKGIKIEPQAKHISYVHSPMRYMYDQFNNYFGEGAPKYQRVAAKLLRPYLQGWDRRSNKQVDLLIANSLFVQSRIKSNYGRNSDIIHPFVDLKDFNCIRLNPPKKENYCLMVTAFAPNKRVDLAIRAFNRSGRPLIIVGQGQQEEYLKSLAKSNIVFLPPQNRMRVVELMAKAKAFIFPGVEDFGITPLEALAAGSPIVALKKGGVLETLNDDVAQFFLEEDVEQLILAVETCLKRTFDREVLWKQANRFTKEDFKLKIIKTIEKVVALEE